MKLRLGSVALVVGLALVFGPWLVLSNPSPWWFLVSLVGLLLAAIAGMGAQMEQLGQGNTGEELLRSIWSWIRSL
jgi:hypothetical protein